MPLGATKVKPPSAPTVKVTPVWLPDTEIVLPRSTVSFTSRPWLAGSVRVPPSATVKLSARITGGTPGVPYSTTVSASSSPAPTPLPAVLSASAAVLSTISATRDTSSGRSEVRSRSRSVEAPGPSAPTCHQIVRSPAAETSSTVTSASSGSSPRTSIAASGKVMRTRASAGIAAPAAFATVSRTVYVVPAGEPNSSTPTISPPTRMRESMERSAVCGVSSLRIVTR